MNNSQKIVAQVVFFALAITFLSISANTYVISARLFVISDNIQVIEDAEIWTVADHEAYSALIAERNSIKESSFIGYLLVAAGGNGFTWIIRMIVLILVFSFSVLLFFITADLIKSDIQYMWKKIQKIKKH